MTAPGPAPATGADGSREACFTPVHGGQWAFASGSGDRGPAGFRPELDRRSARFPGPRLCAGAATGFANVEALAPGTIMVIEPGAPGSARPTRAGAVESTVDARWRCRRGLTALKSTRGRSQSVADVARRGVDERRAVDSSLVVAARHTRTETHDHVNVRSPDESHDETPPRACWRALRDAPVTVDLPRGPLRADAILEYVRHFDQPFADTR